MVDSNKRITKNAESGKFGGKSLVCTIALFQNFEIISAQDSKVFQKATLSRIITLNQHEPSVTRLQKKT